MNKFVCLMLLTFCSLNLLAQCVCSESFHSSFPANINNVDVSLTSSGSVTEFPLEWNSCDETVRVPANAMHIGEEGVFELLFAFDPLVDTVLLIINATCFTEDFHFEINSTDMELSRICGCIEVGSNSLILDSLDTNAGVKISISGSSPFSELRISGSGGQNGSLFGICDVAQTNSSCDLSIDDLNTFCDDNGTPADISDDQFFVILEVNGGSDFGFWNANDIHNSSGNYGSLDTIGPFQISNGNFALIIEDSEESCSAEVDIIAPQTCSDSCILNIDAINTGAYCEGETIALHASGGGSYFWTGPNGFSSADQNPTIPNSVLQNSGVYFLRVSKGKGCLDSTQTTVLVNDHPVLSAGEDQSGCSGREYMLCAEGSENLIYAWSIEDSIMTRCIAVSPEEKTEYIVRGMEELTGCVTVDTVRVTIYAGIEIEYDDLKDSVTASGGTGPIMLTTVREGSTIEVMATDSVGCMAERTFIIDAVYAPELNSEIEIYPNPATEDLYIRYGEVKNEMERVDIFDMLGRKVREYDGSNLPQQIGLEGLSSSQYMLRFCLEDDRCIMKRVIVLRN